jgi:hypothetical protein
MSTDWDQRVADAMADEGIVYAPVDPAETFAEEPEHYGEGPDAGDDESHKPEHIASPMPPRRLLVVGSAQWNQPLVVQAVLLGWLMEHGNPPVVLTVGMGAGAEEHARAFGAARDWTVISQTDIGMLHDAETVDAAFAFVRDGSEVSSLVSAIATRRAIRVFSDEVERPTGAWTRR